MCIRDSIYTEYKKGTNEYNSIEEMAVTERDPDSTEVAGPDAQPKPPIDVDFEKLKSINCLLYTSTRKYIEEGKDEQGKGFDPRKLLAPGTEAIKATVKEKMELFGSVNKA